MKGNVAEVKSVAFPSVYLHDANNETGIDTVALGHVPKLPAILASSVGL